MHIYNLLTKKKSKFFIPVTNMFNSLWSVTIVCLLIVNQSFCEAHGKPYLFKTQSPNNVWLLMLVALTLFRQQKSYDACFMYFWQDLHQRRSASLFHTTWSYQWPSRSGNNRRSPIQTPTSFAVTINRVSVACLFPVDRTRCADRRGLDWTRLVSESVPKSVTASKACAACPVFSGGHKTDMTRQSRRQRSRGNGSRVIYLQG